MAEPDPSPPPSPGSKWGGGKAKLLGAVGAVVVLEAAGIFIVLKMFGTRPQPTHAGTLARKQEAAQSLLHSAEIQIAQFRAPNEKTGQLFVYDMRVAAQVKPADKQRLVKLIADRSGTINDRLIRVVRKAEPEQLKEEDLASLRRQIKYELDKLFEDETMITEILIPYFQKYRSDL